MQLDKTRIAIRERNFLDLFDLALLVVRSHAGPLAGLLLLGAAPLTALNYWLLRGMAEDYLTGRVSRISGEDILLEFLAVFVSLILVQAPLVTAPLTLYLGQALFVPQVSYRRLFLDLWEGLPQVLIAQTLYRALLLAPLAMLAVPALRMVALLLPLTLLLLVRHLAVRPYLAEIILLEKTRFVGQGRRLTTRQRGKRLHAAPGSDLFGRWLVSLLAGGALVASVYLSIHFVRGILTGYWEYDLWMMTVFSQLAVWLVMGYFSVVRFLSYLDVRIRNEGWAVELRLRAEAARLARHLA